MLTEQALERAVVEEAGRWRERLYGPLRTLALFIEQVLGVAPSCQDAVARGLSARVVRGEAPSRLNTGSYCKARIRLALGLIERLGHEVAKLLIKAQPEVGLWRGRVMKWVDGRRYQCPTRTPISVPSRRAGNSNPA